MRHLISIADLARDDVERILETAGALAGCGRRSCRRCAASSCSTSSSSPRRARRRASSSPRSGSPPTTMSLKAAGSSVDKGESLKDTVLTLGGVRAARDRRPPPADRRAAARRARTRRGGRQRRRRQAAAPDPGAARPLHDARGARTGSTACTWRSSATSSTSRVARSLIQALALVGAHTTLVGPPTLLPRGVEALGCETSTDIGAIEAADVVYVLRMQRERMESAYVPSLREYAARWGITPERVRPGQKVMHPGPMNRGVEIDAARRRLAATR